MSPIHYSLSARRDYEFSVIISRVTTGPNNNKHYVSNLKTIHQSGHWLKYDSETANYAALLADGEVLPNDISAELFIHTDKESYLVIKNNLRGSLEPTPNYLLDAKYRIDVVEYTTAISYQLT